RFDVVIQDGEVQWLGDSGSFAFTPTVRKAAA
ncbi:hypothetical protein CEK69_20195, partial [Xanthomonas sp. LMG 12462]